MNAVDDASGDGADFLGFSPQQNKDVEIEREDAITLAKQLHVYKPGIEFVPGAKLEVLDIRDNKWYTCKVVEVDWGELDILVHFERWSARFDEWLKMDSTRIRKAALHQKDNSKLFKVGEKVLGLWTPDGHQYPATIIKHLSDDTWSVKFFDGFTKSLRLSQIQKITKKQDVAHYESIDSTLNNTVVQSEEAAAPPTADDRSGQQPAQVIRQNSIFNVKILEEKRKPKRKPEFEQLFQSMKRRKKSEKEESDEEVAVSPVKKREEGEEPDGECVSEQNSPDRITLNLGVAEMLLLQQQKAVTPSKRLFTTPNKPFPNEDAYDSDVSGKFEGFQATTPSPRKEITSPGTPQFKGFSPVETALPTKTDDENLSEQQVCAKVDCGKVFRNNTLLQMHIKHYHPEVVKQQHLQPLNVVDLAKARTADDHNMASSVECEKKSRERRRTLSKTSKEHTNLDSDFENSPTGRADVSANESDQETTEKRLHEHKARSRRLQLTSESVSEDDRLEETKKRGYRRKARSNATKLPQATPTQGDDLRQPSSDPEAIINCGCGLREEDGLMLQCDVCLCWQHGSCYRIDYDHQVPDKYICQMCDNPKGQRRSSRFRHHQEYLKEGKLARFSFSTDDNKHLEGCLRRGHNLMANVLETNHVVHSLRVKLSIAKQQDHPKLFLWHRPWSRPEDKKINQVSEQTQASVFLEPMLDVIPTDVARGSRQNEENSCAELTQRLETCSVQCEGNSKTNDQTDKKVCEEPPSCDSSLHLNLSASTEKTFNESNNKESPLHLNDISEAAKASLDDLDFNLSALDEPTFVDFPSKAELERLVEEASTQLAPFPSTAQQPPIIPETERIQPLKCKLNLLAHVEQTQDVIARQYDAIEKQVADLEAEMGLKSDFSAQEETMMSDDVSLFRDQATLQSRDLMQMLLRDLDTVSRMIEYVPPKQ